ncbi:MAG TPA: MBL fold metallo-hydrolase [Rhabdochlamydiaceae bacterium]|nr:MBL fold metallo-hydrolase [Rhabdochlamydiaceae bacterium]
MIIKFLGTRGEIEAKTRRHRMHTATLFSYRGKKVMVDCGKNWLGRFQRYQPDHIVLTHAHPDHAWGLKNGSPCPVWATQETWDLIKRYPIEKKQKHLLLPRTPKKIGGILFEPFPVLHSILCPAVGYRIRAGKATLFYVPDVLWIPDMQEAFRGIQVYIGDGATIQRCLVRRNKKTKELFGHAMIRQQLTWCRKQHVPKMIITHCGSDIVKGQEKRAIAKIKALAKQRGVEVEIAYDGLELKL